MTNTSKDVLRIIACAVALFLVAAGVGSVLPITACLVGIVGIVVLCYLLRCQRGQRGRVLFFVLALLWLCGNAAISLFAYENWLLAITSLLFALWVMVYERFSARSLTFFLSIGSLGLLAYGERSFEAGMLMSVVAGLLVILGVLWHLYRVYLLPAFPRAARVLRWLPYVLIAGVSTVAPGLILLCLLDVIPSLLARTCPQCGVHNAWWRAALMTLSFIAPLGFNNFIFSIVY